MGSKRRTQAAAALSAALVFTSCSTPPAAPGAVEPERSSPGATGSVLPSRSGSFAFAAAQFRPTVVIDSPASGAARTAGASAAKAAASCLVIPTAGDPFSVLLMLACMPVAALIGGVAGSATAAPPEGADAASRRLEDVLRPLEGQRELLKQAMGYAHESGLSPASDWSDQAPTALADRPAYRSTPARSADYVVELGLTQVRAQTPGTVALPYAFELSARGRLVRVSDNSVIDTFGRTETTGAFAVDAWTADNARLAATELRAALRRIAEAYVDEWLLIYPDPGARPASAASEGGPVPDYVLRPVDPPVRQGVRIFSRPLFMGAMEPVSVASVAPTLSWEPLPRSMAHRDGAASPQRIENVRYHVRVFRPGPATPGAIAAGPEIAHFSGLTAPSVRIEPPLEPCAYYFWTVRARFELEGRSRATEWSGAYAGIGGVIDPRWARRAEWPALYPQWPNRFLYFPFRTPSAGGSACP